MTVFTLKSPKISSSTLVAVAATAALATGLVGASTLTQLDDPQHGFPVETVQTNKARGTRAPLPANPTDTAANNVNQPRRGIRTAPMSEHPGNSGLESADLGPRRGSR